LFLFGHNSMPDLSVCDRQGRLRPDDVVRIFAAMLHPNDGDRRQQFEARAFTEVAAKRGEASFDQAALKALLDAERHPFDPGGNPLLWENGELAGEQLLWVFSLRDKAPEHASLNKAIALMEAERRRDGERGGRSMFKDAWSKYSSVAHFWAAFLAKNRRFNILPDPNGLLDFEGMLINATVIGDWRQTFMDSTDPDPWKMPPHWLPRPRPPWLPWGYQRAVDDWALAVLNGYRVGGVSQALKVRGRRKKVARP
jgi:hypothetical protein